MEAANLHIIRKSPILSLMTMPWSRVCLLCPRDKSEVTVRLQNSTHTTEPEMSEHHYGVVPISWAVSVSGSSTTCWRIGRLTRITSSTITTDNSTLKFNTIKCK